MKTWSKWKKWVIGVVIALAVCAVATSVRQKEKKLLASLAAVAETPESDLRKGRLVLRNTTTNQLVLIVCGTEKFTNGTWHLVADHFLSTWPLDAGKSIELKFNPPSGTNKWRGVLQVCEQDHRLTTKLKVFGREALGGFKYGFNWPNVVFNGPQVITSEVEP